MSLLSKDYATRLPREGQNKIFAMQDRASTYPKKVCVLGLGEDIVRKVSDNLHQPALVAAPPMRLVQRYTFLEINGDSRVIVLEIKLRAYG